ncbi:MAG: methionyl-tRNA formyltransferase [Legionellales bacterium RIFCSPHIGHO2_12_FULL_42_9]|nr:MAG: methionyl-tRNA formyltransferase [Legionellales bacterium RIFCSPHIGHO2_12_FULL_42_9]
MISEAPRALKIVFAGTPEFGLPSLDAIWNSTHQLIAVYTQPDRPIGRGQTVQFSPVKQWGLDHQLPVVQPLNFKEQQTIDELAGLKPDVLVVIAYGLLLPETVLQTAPFGCINVHSSLLPRWRGASPIQQVILHGDDTTGITIMKMDIGLDTGPMFTHEVMPVAASETAGSLHDKLAMLAVKPLLNTLDKLAANQIILDPQDDRQATYAPKIKKEDAHVNWKLEASVIERQIRAYSPWPIARTYGHGDLIRIHQAHVLHGNSDAVPGTVLSIDKQGMIVATGQDKLCVERVQFAGGKVMSVADWVNGGRAESFMNLILE